MTNITALFRMTTRRVAALLVGGLTVLGAAPQFAVAPNTASAEPATSTTTTATYPTSWELTVTPDSVAKAAGRDAFVERVMFDSLGYTAEVMSAMGFTPKAATINASGVFSVTLVSDHHGSMLWNGTVTTTSVTGTIAWTKGGTTYKYTFTGVPFTPEPAES